MLRESKLLRATAISPASPVLADCGIAQAPFPAEDPAVMEVFRRLFLERLHRAERLSESFMHNILS